LLWTIICVVSAAPSFVFAQREFDRAAMVVGVCLFIAGYTAATSTAAFDRFHRRPFVRRTLYIGYGLRLILSIAMPLGALPLLFFADVIPGLISINIVKSTGVRPESFHGTLLTTIVQGALLNAIVFGVMLVIYWFQRLFMTPPPTSERLHGFEVVMPASPASRVSPVGPAPLPAVEKAL
jgi:hypothetical protein